MTHSHSQGGRRRFMAQLGGLATLAAGATFSGSATTLEAQEHGMGDVRRRVNEAFRLRVDAALFQKRQPLPLARTNGDERRYANFIGNFSKTLPHDPFGIVDRAAYEALLHAMTTEDFDDFALIPQGGVGKLVDPQSAFAFQMDGADSHHLDLRAPAAFSSAEEAGEMAELYWAALTRDVPYANYATDPTIAAAAANLSTFSDFRGPKQAGQVTPATIFRGNTAGDLIGPYISQFLAKTFNYGPFALQQKLRPGLADTEYLWDYASWLANQNGAAAGAFAIVDAANARFINDARALSAYLRADFSPQGFINAALMLLPLGPSALSPTNPYRTSVNQTGQATFGGGELIDLIAHASGVALKACWYQKWALHRRLRPDAFGGAIHNMRTTTERYAIHPEILNASVLDVIHAKYGTYLLPMAYPEGSPAHPAYPAGHAAFAGAGATILKAFFDESLAVPSPVVSTADGTALEAYTGPTLTVGNELNKLASNIAVGRGAPGVHWRSDGVEGMRLGEAAAIAVLQDVVNCYSERFAGFRFTRFDGTPVRIDPA